MKHFFLKFFFWKKSNKVNDKINLKEDNYIDIKQIKDSNIIKPVSFNGTSENVIKQTIKLPHPLTNIGKLRYGEYCYISPTAQLDLSGDIILGNYVIISHYVKIFTHEHNVKSKKKIILADEEYGVKYSNLIIGDDVYVGIHAIITEKVTNIPDGVVIGAGSLLTKNPNPYEIWAGVPAKKIGERQ